MKRHDAIPNPTPPWMTGPEPVNPYHHLLDELPDEELDDPEEIKLGLAIPKGWKARRK